MSAERSGGSRTEYKKAKDLKVIVRFEKDDSSEGKMRVAQVRSIICQLILLGKKRGRPSKEKEGIHAAA